MDGVLPRDLRNSLNPQQGLNAQLDFEGGTVRLPRRFGLYDSDHVAVDQTQETITYAVVRKSGPISNSFSNMQFPGGAEHLHDLTAFHIGFTQSQRALTAVVGGFVGIRAVLQKGPHGFRVFGIGGSGK